MVNTSWWRYALAAPAVVPDFSVIRAHVCGMPARVDKHHLSPCQTLLSGNWTYFPEACRERGEASATSPEFGKGIDGVGHFGQFIVEGIRERRGAPPRLARFFGESASVAGAYFVGVGGLGDGFDPSLYCHERDHVKQALDPKRPSKRCEPAAAFREHFASLYPTGAALFRDHFECYLAPPLDAWFGFDALPPAGAGAWDRGDAVAETYAALGRGAVAGACGAGPGAVRLVIHLRLGDILHLAGRAEGARLRNALVAAAALVAALPGPAHVAVLSDSPPATVAGLLDGDVTVRVGDARSDGVSRLVSGRTAGLGARDLDVDFHGAGNPLVALHCMAAADALLGPEACGEPWVPGAAGAGPPPGATRHAAARAERRRKREDRTRARDGGAGGGRDRDASRRLGARLGAGRSAQGDRCSHMVNFARQLSARGVFRGLPVEPLNATAVDAGLGPVLALLAPRAGRA